MARGRDLCRLGIAVKCAAHTCKLSDCQWAATSGAVVSMIMVARLLPLTTATVGSSR